MNLHIQDLFEYTIGIFTLPLAQGVKCSVGTGFSVENMPKPMPKLRNKSGIVIMYKIF